MSEHILNRIVQALVVAFGVMTLVFVMVRLAPGNPADMWLGEGATAADAENLRQLWGLDRPMHEQYLLFLKGVAQGNLGYSLHYRQPAVQLMLSHFPATIKLTLAALFLALAIAIPLGIVSAMKRDSVWDYLSLFIALAGQALPNFWVGLILILVLGVRLGWLPTFGSGGLKYMIMPAIVLGMQLTALVTRLVRSGLLEVMGEDYIRTARAKGLTERTVVWRHAMRNIGLPLVTLIGLNLGHLLGGSLIVEMVFSWPGIGWVAFTALANRDYPVVQAAVLFASLTFVFVNLLVDLLYGYLDPRIRLT